MMRVASVPYFALPQRDSNRTNRLKIHTFLTRPNLMTLTDSLRTWLLLPLFVDPRLPLQSRVSS